jgi:hypothetical protein
VYASHFQVQFKNWEHVLELHKLAVLQQAIIDQTSLLWKISVGDLRRVH